MSTYHLRIILIITLLLCILNYNTHSHTNENSIDSKVCPITLVSQKDILSIFFDIIERDNISGLLALEGIHWNIRTSYQNGQILLYYASFLGRVRIIYALVFKLGVNVNIADQSGLTALHYAMLNEDISSRIDTIYTLIQLGASVGVGNYGSQIADEENTLSPKYSLEQKRKISELAFMTSIQQIAKLFQINYHTLSKWTRSYKREQNIPIKTYRVHSQKRKTRAIYMVVKLGIKPKQVVEYLGVPERTLSKWLYAYRKEHGIKAQASYSQEFKDKAIRMRVKEGMTLKEVEKILKAPKNTLSTWVNQDKRKNNIHVQSHYPQWLRNKAVRMVIGNGMTPKAVAEELDISKEAVSKWVYQYKKKHNMPMRKPYSQKFKNALVKMVTEVHIDIGKVAKRFNVPRVTLSRWVHQYGSEYIIKKQVQARELKNQAIKMVIEDNISEVQVAKDLKISRGTISSWIYQHRKKHNIPVHKISYSQEQKDKAIEKVIVQGLSIKAVAKELRASESSVSSWIRQHKEENDIEVKKIEYYPSELKEEAIEMMIEDKMRVAQVAKKLDVSKDNLRRWFREYNKNKTENKKALN